MRIKITDNLDEFTRGFTTRQQERIRKTAAIALTKTAQRARAAVVREMKTVFHKPVRFTLNSLYVKPAIQQLLVAEMYVKESALRYLHPQIFGGARVLKRFELQLSRAGMMPIGMFAVPGSAARMDGYGNMSRGQIVQIMSQLRAQMYGGYESRLSVDPRRRAASLRRQGGAYFVGQPGGKRLPLGVWQRVGKKVKPVLIYVTNAQYKKLLKFHEVAVKVGQEAWPEEFSKAWMVTLARMR